MPEDLNFRKDLKEKFIQDLNPYEQFFSLKKAKEVIILKGYPVCEDPYHYCYFLTIKERFRCISTEGAGGLLRFLLVEGTKDVEEAIKLYKERLQEKRLPAPDIKGDKFLEYLTE